MKSNAFELSRHPAWGPSVVLLLIIAETVGWSVFATQGYLVSWGGGQSASPAALTNITAVSSALDHSLALTSDGLVIAWGYDFDGQCDVPAGLGSVISIAAGSFFSVALKADGTVVAWGDNQFGQTQVPLDATNVTAISAGRGHVLALKSGGTLEAWGSDVYGQCDVPPGVNNVVAILACWNYSLALRSDGTIAAWGVDDEGQTEVPPGLSNVSMLAGNMEYCLALKTDGTVVPWGKAPLMPSGLGGVRVVAAGEDHCLALTSNNIVVVWGANDSGQLDVPSNPGKVISLAAGWNYSVALATGGVISTQIFLSKPAWADGLFTVSVPSQTNKLYLLQYKTTLTDPSWTSFSIVSGTGLPVMLSNPSGTNNHRFYGVQEQ
jgi:alpha-tubulin suppressor-like RCC1 family protein